MNFTVSQKNGTKEQRKIQLVRNDPTTQQTPALTNTINAPPYAARSRLRLGVRCHANYDKMGVLD